jgi:transposase-like protein
MTHRIREAMREPDQGQMGGGGSTVEVDETFVGGRKRGRNVRGLRYGPADKEPVVTLVERGGEARSFHVPRVTNKTVRAILRQQLSKAAHLRTDEAKHYRRIGKEYASHERVHHSIAEYVRGDAHTNTIENYFSILKRGLTGVYQHVSAKHLKRYLSEFDYRYNTRQIEDAERAAKALSQITGRRLTYRRTA